MENGEINKIDKVIAYPYEFLCKISTNDNLPRFNSEIILYSLEFCLLFKLSLLTFDFGNFNFFGSLILTFIFNYYFMYCRGLKKYVRKKLKIY